MHEYFLCGLEYVYSWNRHGNHQRVMSNVGDDEKPEHTQQGTRRSEEAVGCGRDMRERGMCIWLVHWLIG